MNCPNCGSPISGLCCSKCNFNLKQNDLYYIGDSADKQIPALVKYIREKTSDEQSPDYYAMYKNMKGETPAEKLDVLFKFIEEETPGGQVPDYYAICKYIEERIPRAESNRSSDPRIIETLGTSELPLTRERERKFSALPDMLAVSVFLSSLKAKLLSRRSKRNSGAFVTSQMVMARRNHAKRVSIALKMTCLVVLLADIFLALSLRSGYDIYDIIRDTPNYLRYIVFGALAFGLYRTVIKIFEWQDADGELRTNLCALSERLLWLLSFTALIVLLLSWACGKAGWPSWKLFWDRIQLNLGLIPYIFAAFVYPIIQYLECSRIYKKYHYGNLHYVLWWIISMGLCILLAVLTLPGPSSHIKALLAADEPAPYADGADANHTSDALGAGDDTSLSRYEQNDDSEDGADLSPPDGTEAPVTLEAGDVISLGHYEQDGDFENGAEELFWFIASISDGQAHVLCQSCIDAMPYCEDGSSNLWGNSTIRSWLNQDFINSAFSAEEQSVICETQLETKGIQNIINDAQYGIYIEDPGTETTADRIFLPSLTDNKWLENLNISGYAVDKLSGLYSDGVYDEDITLWRKSHTPLWFREPSGVTHNERYI